MAEPLTLIGYRYSVYTRVVRMALLEKGLAAAYVEVDPFARPVPHELAAHTPFVRVPVLVHSGFTLYETASITGYLDRLVPAPSLRPADARAEARMRQIIGIVDSDVYPVLVRQVFSNAVFAPRFGQPVDRAALKAGLARSPLILAALERIAREGRQLIADPSLADLHLAPMLAYFAMAAEGAAQLRGHGALSDWFARIRRRPSFAQTIPL